MAHSFFALISRMRYIGRWGLMRSSIPENIQEHSQTVAVLAHALGLIRRDVFGAPCDPNALAAFALYHDASEILTGDLPTPIKYHNAEICGAYKQVEQTAAKKLLNMLPVELKDSYRPLLSQEVDEESKKLIKAADKLSAYIKCIEERKAGNNEFLSAEAQTLQMLKSMALPELNWFMERFIPAYELDLDKLGALGEGSRTQGKNSDKETTK